MNDFKKLLEKQMQKVKTGISPSEAEPDARSIDRGRSELMRDGSNSVVSKREAPAKPKSVRQEPRQAEPVVARAQERARSVSANLNRVTVNLFDADRRALAVIKEKLGNAGHDFTNRSDSIKVALRIASKAKREELVQAFEQVKAEDRRFKNVD